MSMYIWLGIAALMGIVEALSLGLITMWFVVGGIAAFIAAYLGADFIVQLFVFIVVSVLSLVLLRPAVMKYRAAGKTHEASLIGQHAVVVETIDTEAMSGRVETPDHMTWAAISVQGIKIEKGTSVKIIDQQSIKVVVEQLDN